MDKDFQPPNKRDEIPSGEDNSPIIESEQDATPEAANIPAHQIAAAVRIYNWLWISPLLTIPTLIVALLPDDIGYYLSDLVCPPGRPGCDDTSVYWFLGMFALIVSSLWHLILLRNLGGWNSEFVRWHAKQALVFAGIRTAIPIIYFNASIYKAVRNMESMWTALPGIILIGLITYFVTASIGQNQAKRGDCWLMRVFSQGQALPHPNQDSSLDEDSNKQNHGSNSRLAIIGLLLATCIVAPLGLTSLTFSEFTPISPNSLTATQSAWVRPAASITLGSAEEAQQAERSNDFRNLEGYARFRRNSLPEINQPGDIYLYEIFLSWQEQLLWNYNWCASTSKILEENIRQMNVSFELNGAAVPQENVGITINETASGYCRTYTILIKEWVDGQHLMKSMIEFTQPTNDGWNLYPAGMHVYQYLVTINIK